MSLIEKNKEDNLKNLQLLAKLQELGLNSWGDEKPRQPNKLLSSPYTAKMVDDYKKMLDQPYIDPNTGEKFKFKPLDPPDLDNVDETKLITIRATEDEIRNTIEQVQNEIKELEKEKSKLEKRRNNLKIFLDRILNTPNPKAESIENYEKNTELIKKYNENINQISIEIKDRNELIPKLMLEIERVREDTAHNQDIINDVKKYNELKLKNYRDELKLLNKGDLSFDQQPDETEEEYLKRIGNLKVTPYTDNNLITQATVYNIQKFKDNLKELIRNDIIIDQVLNMVKLDIDNGLFLFNQKFNLFKTEYLKKYGFNNENVSSEDLYNLIEKFLNEDELPSGLTAKQSITYYQPQFIQQQQLIEGAEQPKRGVIAPGISFELLNNNKTMKIINDTNGIFIYIKIAILNKKEQILISKTGEPNSFESILFISSTKKPDENNFKYLMVDYLGISEFDYRNTFPTNSINKDLKKPDVIFNFFKSKGLEEDSTNETLADKKITIDRREYQVYGMGLRLKPDEKLSKYCQFGKINLELHKLYYKNILSIQNNNGLKLAGFKNTPVSDGFVNIVMKLCRNQEPTIQDMNQLKANEKGLFDGLLQVAGLQKRNITGSSKETINYYKKQLALVEGQIEAGNNNNLVLQELYDILFKLVYFGVLSESQARNHYKQIKKEYF